MASEYPKTLYRYDAETGEKLGKTFASADDVEKGWVCHDDLGPPPQIKAKPEAAPSAVEAGKRLVAAERENAALKDSVKLYEDNAKLDAAKLEASAARVAELEAFVQLVAADAKCPADLKEAIAGLFAPAGADEPKPKRTKK